jgi:hypothetical protein
MTFFITLATKSNPLTPAQHRFCVLLATKQKIIPKLIKKEAGESSGYGGPGKMNLEDGATSGS